MSQLTDAQLQTLEQAWVDARSAMFTSRDQAMTIEARVNNAFGKDCYLEHKWKVPDCSDVLQTFQRLASMLFPFAEQLLSPEGLSVNIDLKGVLDRYLQKAERRHNEGYESWVRRAEKVIHTFSIVSLWEAMRTAFAPEDLAKEAVDQADRALRDTFYELYRRHEQQQVIMKGGRFILTMRIGDSYRPFQLGYDDVARFRKAIEAFANIATYHGNENAAQILRDGATVLMFDLGRHSHFESRQKRSVGEHLTIVLFKESAQFHISPVLGQMVQATLATSNARRRAA